MSFVEEDESHGSLDTLDEHSSKETILPESTPTKIDNIRRQNDLKLFYTELGFTEVQQPENSLSDQVRIRYLQISN